MNIRRSFCVVLIVGVGACMSQRSCDAQCCLTELFSGCRKAPTAYAVAPVMAPVMAPPMVPMAAPVAAPPPPVVVPVQQVSYVPETTYRTQYQCVPVTSYKPTCEIDPCTGCSRECMEQVTQYVQQAVNVPVTQYRAVYTTKYVQMQPGYSPQGAYAAPGQASAPVMGPGPTGAAPSPFAASIQTTPQAWGAAGTDVPQQLIQPGQQSIAAPTLPGGAVPQQGFQQPVYQQQQPGFQQQVLPQSGTYAAPGPSAVQPQSTVPPVLAPTPSLKPIPELPKNPAVNGNGAVSGSTVQPMNRAMPNYSAPVMAPQTLRGSATTPNPFGAPVSGAATNDANGMPVLPGVGPSASTNAFPKLLEPTGHTTSWQPASGWQQPLNARPSGYPTAALPGRVQ